MLPVSASSSERPQIPIIRGLEAARCYWCFFRDPVACLKYVQRRNGPLTALGHLAQVGQREFINVVALGPDYNRQVLGNPSTFISPGQVVPGPRNTALQRIRAGMTKMNGDKYRRQRQLILPLFTPSAIQAYSGPIQQVAAEQIDSWSVGTPVNMWELLRHMALRIAARVLFGRIDTERADRLGELIRGWIVQGFSAGAFLLRVNWPLLPYRRLVLHAERMEQELLTIIRERRQDGDVANPDMLDRLIKARDEDNGKMDDADLVGQATILFLASFETQTNALAWTLYLLAQHPQVMADLHDELETELHGQPPTIAQFSKLPLLDAVLKESMRILPPVPYTLRKVGEPTVLGDFPLTPGCRVICSHYITHHLPELYEQPERFDPRRWETIKPGPYEYLPFSAGPRYCTGATLATTTMKIILAMVLQKWRLAMVPGARIDRAVKITMFPKLGLPMTVHPQDRCFAAQPVKGNIHEMVDLSGNSSPRRTIIPRLKLPWAA